MVLKQGEQFALMVCSCIFLAVYLVMAFKLIFIRYKTYDRFTLILTFVSIISMGIETGSACGAWYMSSHEATKSVK